MEKLSEVNRQPKHQNDTMIRSRNREQKEKMKKYADKRRHTAVMKIKVGDTVLRKQERKNSLTPPYDPVPMVVIGIKGDMITAKNNLKIHTRNYADWKLLKNGCKESLPCDDSDNEDTFDPDAVPADNSDESLQGPEQSRADGDTSEEQSRADGDTGEDESRQRAEQPRSDPDTEQGPASCDCDRPRRKITSTKNTRYKDFICD